MQNNPELNTNLLGKVSSDFVKVADNIREASYAIRKNELSKHPIFAMCKEEQPIGKILVDKYLMGNEWYYYASFLKEFMQRGLITQQETFELNYKDPDEFCCLFILSQDFINFIFIPYPVD